MALTFLAERIMNWPMGQKHGRAAKRPVYQLNYALNQRAFSLRVKHDLKRGRRSWSSGGKAMIACSPARSDALPDFPAFAIYAP